MTSSPFLFFGSFINFLNNILIGVMLVDVYLFLLSIGFILMILSFLKRDILVFAWIPVLIFSILAFLSLEGIETPYCSYGTSWNCYLYRYESANLSYTWLGFTVFQLAYALIISIWRPVEQLTEAEQKPYMDE